MFLSRLFLRLWLLDESTVKHISYTILQTYFLKKAASVNIQLMKVVNLSGTTFTRGSIHI